jgi:cell division transport system permease protein
MRFFQVVGTRNLTGAAGDAQDESEMNNTARPTPGKNTARSQTGAKRGRSARQRFTGWIEQHMDACADALQRVWTQPLNSLMSLMVIAIALLLPALVYVAGNNMAQFGGSLQNTNRISFYLQPGTSPEQAQALQALMTDHALVDRVEFISSQQAAADFAHWSGLGDVIDSFGDNPLPASLEAHPADMRAETALQIRDAFADDAAISQVVLDVAWVERLDSLMRLTDRMVLALILVLSLAVLFVIGNTVRTHIAGRDAEIRVMTLIGATRSFISRPFLYSGALQGLLGAAVAWGLLQGLLQLLAQPAQELLAFYGDQYVFVGMNLQASLLMMAGGLLLGWTGAALSLSRHLDKT